MRSMWLRPGPTPGTTVPVFGRSGAAVIRVGGIAFLAVLFGILWTIGYAVWS